MTRLFISASARRDIASALEHSARRWGLAQQQRDQALVGSALHDLRQDPVHPASRACDEIRLGVRAFHIARPGQAGRHLVVYRLDPAGNVQVIRLLHDATALGRALGDD